MGLQRLLHIAFPPQCVSCHSMVAEDFALCGPCWRDTPFIRGLACRLCGAPLMGDDDTDTAETCDDCLTIARPWNKGRAVLDYRDNGRRLVLSLKHADRLDLAKPAAVWMADAGRDLLQSKTILVPVPVHRLRLLHRRYNQAAVLAMGLARHTGLRCVPDALIRQRSTPTQNGKTRDARFANLMDAIVPNKRFGTVLDGSRVVLIDDVMTSGATFAAATGALHRAGASDVSVLALARAGKDDYIRPKHGT